MSINIWIGMDQSQDCETSRIIIDLKSVSLSLAIKWTLVKSYFNIADLPISRMSAIRISFIG